MKKIEPNKFRTPVFYLLLLALLIVVYAPAINGPFIFDDKPDIEGNPFIKHSMASAILKNPFRSITYLSYYANYKLADLSSTCFRITNILIHLMNVILLSKVVGVLRPNDKLSQLLSAGIFCISPFSTSTVNYISARSTLLATMFGLLAILSSLKMINGNNSIKCGFVALVSYIFALESKESAAAISPS